MALPVITSGRSFGSGGRLIGEKVATLLSVPLYDKDLVQIIAERSGFSAAVVEHLQQKKPGSLLYTLSTSPMELPLQDQIFFAQSAVIKELAHKEPCVIVGRCADSILEEEKVSVLKTFVYAPLKMRAERARDVYHIEAKDMEDYVRKMDKKRRAYYDYFAHRTWGKLENYDLAVNSAIGIDLAAELIARAAREISAKNP